MTLAEAEWHDVLKVLHETYRIWSPGLDQSAYRELAWRQMSHPWSRRHYRYLVYKRGGKIASSCKLYELQMRARGREYRVLGIGAVYTLEDCRNTGCASDLMEGLHQLAEKEQFDAMLLYSEIGPEFYEQFEFEELGSADFMLCFAPNSSQEPELYGGATRTRFLQCSDIPTISRYHRRWLAKQYFGVERSHQYWNYKISKERFLQRNSRLSWPSLELITYDEDGNDGGYMIMEQGGSTIRLLEVIGSQTARLALWKQLMARAVEFGADRIRGWEAGILDFAPGFSFQSVLPESLPESSLEPLMYSDRDWGVPMICPLREELRDWSFHFPCPLLELDHF